MAPEVAQAVIVCGGRGTRMGDLTKKTPKPLLPVGGRPLLAHTLDLLELGGIERVILAAGYQADAMEELVRQLPSSRLDLDVSVEPLPLGTAGAVKRLAGRLDQHFVVVYGDEFLDIDIRDVVETHLSAGALGTILARPSTHPWDADLIQTDAENRVTEIVTAREPGRHYQNLGNAGVYILRRQLLDLIPADTFTDFLRDTFPIAARQPSGLGVHVMSARDYVKDMGTPERITEIEEYLTWRADRDRRMKHPGPVETVFVDRDGVLNRDVGLVTSPEQLELLEGAAEGVRLLNDAGLKVVIVTNQPVIARGLVDEAGLDVIHQRLRQLLASEGARIDGLYFCPHHPETRHGEGIVAMRRACDCRKPAPGMLLTAARELRLDLARSVMIGDSAVDIDAGRNAGVRTVLIGRREVRPMSTPTLIASDLLSAARSILAGSLDVVLPSHT